MTDQETNDDLAGLTSTACPVGCNETRCCISGVGKCAHPNKGGLDAGSLQSADARRKFDAAREILARDGLEKHAEARRTANGDHANA